MSLSTVFGSHRGKVKKYTYGSISLSEDDNSLYDDDNDDDMNNGEYDYDTRIHHSDISSSTSYVRIHNHPINKSHSHLRNHNNYFYWFFGCLLIMAIFGIATFVKHETFLAISDSTQSLLYTTVNNNIQPPSSIATSKIATTTTTTVEKPHIIYILADDLGWNSIGHKEYDLAFATPTLSSLASQGIVLDSYYAQEICTPARAALLTGRYPLSVGMQYGMVQTAIPWGLDTNETLLPEILRDNGYATHMLGKWHLGHYSPKLLPTARGFDTFLGYLNGETYYWSKRNPDHTQFTDIMSSTTDCYTPYSGSDKELYSTFLYRDKAIGIINNHAKSYTTTIPTTTTTAAAVDKSATTTNTTTDAIDGSATATGTDDDSKNHKSLFLYLAFQAVHDPFVDLEGAYPTGIPMEYVGESVYHQVMNNVTGIKRQQYALALYLLDQAVDSIIQSLRSSGMWDNTLVVFSSDNGGCFSAGGKNGPLRGTKGTLFEGGVRVDSFAYSASTAIIPQAAQGSIYKGLFHISDWFPTILSLAHIEYAPKEGYELDSFNQWGAMTRSTGSRSTSGSRSASGTSGSSSSGDNKENGGGGYDSSFGSRDISSGRINDQNNQHFKSKAEAVNGVIDSNDNTDNNDNNDDDDSNIGPRQYMLYNHYTNVDIYAFDTWINGTFAVRNHQYKLMHTFDDESYASFYSPTTLLDDDDNIEEEARCCVSCGANGNFTYWLFDLHSDPYETLNLYTSDLPHHTTVKQELYSLLASYDAKSYRVTFDFSPNVNALNVWRDHDDSMVPSVMEEDLIASPLYDEFPHDCSNYNNDDDDDDDGSVDNHENTVHNQAQSSSSLKTTKDTNASP